ncbi:hypothetical protein Taro_049436 [Colocasia esculenta]|uniref:Uncharacterized protein n=1 Tax=Colocasia esculenta TaxID=4460 RepID=A0A843XB31_COLES|nr:hypothetical protein [Colocasia esculenta]
MESWFESSSACAPCVARGAGKADVMNGKATASYVAIRIRIVGACSLCEDTTCSGRNAVWDSYLTFFAEFVGVLGVIRKRDSGLGFAPMKATDLSVATSMAMESGAWAPVALEERVACCVCVLVTRLSHVCVLGACPGTGYQRGLVIFLDTLTLALSSTSG